MRRGHRCAGYGKRDAVHLARDLRRPYAVPHSRADRHQGQPYALGALALGTSIGNPDHDDSVRIIHRALDAGINVIDTADAYGESEVVVGKALNGRRDSVVLATKVGRPVGDDPSHQGACR